jgi:hypothetical protein
MRFRKICGITFICFWVLFLASAGVDAAPILFNTGVDNDGNVLDILDTDPHYAMSGVSDRALVFPQWGTWVDPPDPSAAAWIGPLTSIEGAPVGEYRYTLEFDLGGSVPRNFAISGKWASDNISKIELNGKDTGFATPVGFAFSMLHDFTLNSGFKSGINELAFVVENIGIPATDNPTGLLITDVQAVPIPGALWLMGSGLLCFVGLRRAFRFGKKSP